MLLLLPQYGLLSVDLVGVVVVVLSAEKERELGVVLLLGLGHLLELGPVPGHEIRQFVDDVAHLGLRRGRRQLRHGCCDDRDLSSKGRTRTTTRPCSGRGWPPTSWIWTRSSRPSCCAFSIAAERSPALPGEWGRTDGAFQRRGGRKAIATRHSYSDVRESANFHFVSTVTR